MNSIKGTPWDTMPSAEHSDLPQPISIEPEWPDVVAKIPEAFAREATARKVYITKRNLEKYGYTANCPACDGTRLGTRSTGAFHTDACRARIEEAMEGDPAEAPRRERAEDRANEWVARRLEAEDAVRAGGESVRPLPGQGQLGTTALGTSSSSRDVLVQPPSGVVEVAAEGRLVPMDTALERDVRGEPEREAKRIRVEDRSRKRDAEHQAGPGGFTDDGEDAVMSAVLETRSNAICQLEKELASGMHSYPVCEEGDGFDEQGYLDAYFDDVTGRELDSAKVSDARRIELDFINEIGVWKIVKRSELESDTSIVKG